MRGIRWGVERLTGAGAVLVSAGAIVTALRFPGGGGSVPGPAVFPLMAAGLLGMLGTVLILTHWPPAGSGPRVQGSLRLLLGVSVLTIAYAALMPLLGFISSSALFLTLAARWLGYPHGWRAAAIGLSAAFIVHALFAGMMKVPLPAGWLG